MLYQIAKINERLLELSPIVRTLVIISVTVTGCSAQYIACKIIDI
jgi:hypothetical protein